MEFPDTVSTYVWKVHTESAFTHLTFYTILRETADVDTYKIKQWTYSHSGYEI